MRIFEMTPLAYSKAAIPDRQLLADCGIGTRFRILPRAGRRGGGGH